MNALHGMVVWLAVSGGAPAPPAEPITEVRDHAELFRPEVVTRVNRELQQIGKTYQCDVVIETVRELPEELRAQLDKTRNIREAARLFAGWATEKARDLRLNGVYILISNVPRYHHVQVTVWPEEQDPPLLRTRDQNQIRRAFTDGQNRRNVNERLEAMVEELRECLGKNLTADNSPAPLAWSALGLISLAVLMFWGLDVLVRLRTSGVSVPGSALQALAQGKAISGMLGGMFGTLAAQPIYDRVLREQVREEMAQGLLPVPPTPPMEPPIGETAAEEDKELVPEEKVV
jgi:hypothetical protein